MTDKLDDKQIELNRYDSRASRELDNFDSHHASKLGAELFADYLRTPYLHFESLLKTQLSSEHKVLEIGAGTGQHTDVLAKSGADVTASDISENSLKLLQARIKQQLGVSVATQVADMEKLPFDDNSFDYIVCAGSLSYGEPCIVDAEFKRVLRPKGCIICVDSLNHNPVYRFNRWVNYLRGNRSRSTLLQMPDLDRINMLSKGFQQVDVKYFGAFSYLMPLVSKVIGNAKAKTLSDKLDTLVGCKRSAFKFVIVANNLNKQ